MSERSTSELRPAPCLIVSFFMNFWIYLFIYLFILLLLSSTEQQPLLLTFKNVHFIYLFIYYYY